MKFYYKYCLNKKYLFINFEFNFKHNLSGLLLNSQFQWILIYLKQVFKNVTLMDATCHLFKVNVKGTINNKFEGFELIGIYNASYSNSFFIIPQASTGIEMWEKNFNFGNLNLNWFWYQAYKY